MMKNPDAIISVDENLCGHLIKTLTSEFWKVKVLAAGEGGLSNYTFEEKPGLYYAYISINMPCGYCFAVDWEILGPLFVLEVVTTQEHYQLTSNFSSTAVICVPSTLSKENDKN
jgi:hypothetical protein